MQKPDFKMMGAAVRLFRRSLILMVRAFPDRRSMSLRLGQMRVCIRAFLRGMRGGKTKQSSRRSRAEVLEAARALSGAPKNAVLSEPHKVVP